MEAKATNPDEYQGGDEAWSAGESRVFCEYCGVEVTPETDTGPDDPAGWVAIAAAHAEDCEWVATRAHTLESA